MSLKHAFACCSAALALLPATASAQGAGDDQYSDPFGDEEEQAQPTPAPRAPAATPAPAQPSRPAQPSQPAQPAQTPAQGQPAPAATPSGPTLPYTGAEGWLIGAGGALLLGAGITLRVRLRAPD